MRVVTLAVTISGYRLDSNANLSVQYTLLILILRRPNGTHFKSNVGLHRKPLYLFERWAKDKR